MKFRRRHDGAIETWPMILERRPETGRVAEPIRGRICRSVPPFRRPIRRVLPKESLPCEIAATPFFRAPSLELSSVRSGGRSRRAGRLHDHDV